MRQSAQAFCDLIALHPGSRIGAGIAQGHCTDFHAGALSDVARLAHDRLQLVDEAIDRRRHVANLILAVDLHTLGEIALACRQIIHRRVEHFQAIDHPMTSTTASNSSTPQPTSARPRPIRQRNVAAAS